jgi:peroxiredoxin
MGYHPNNLARRWFLLSGVITFIMSIALAPLSLVYAESDAGKSAARVLHFPKDRSLGRVTFADADIQESRYDFHFWYGQPEYEEAEGNVVVPLGKEAALFLYKDSFRDLSPLLELKPDDLFMLCPMSTFHKHSFSQRNMEHIAHLTGLRVFTIRSIGNSSENMKPITKLQSLEKLILPHGTTNMGLSYVSQIKSLKRLIFARNKVTNAGIKRHIPKLTNLEYLALYGGIMDDYCLQCLVDLPSLRELSLNSGNFTDAGLTHVKKCSSLRILDLNHLPVTDAGLRHLSALTGLEDLSLYNTEVTDRGLVYLKSMPSLKKLDVKKRGQKDQITDSGMVHLAQIGSLERLELPGGITDMGMAHIANLKNLQHFWGGGSTDAALEHISKLQSLEYLHTGSSGYTDAGMSHLAKLTNLKDLRLSAESMTNEGLAKLRTLKSLERLELTKCNKVTISGLSGLNALDNLTVLNLNRGIIQDNSGLDISRLTRLEDLGLNLEAPICDNDLACLKKLKNLRYLAIGRKEGHPFTDAGIAHLKDLPNIRELYCHSPYLTDKSLSYLANMKTLNFLTIIGNFTDNGLGYLEQLKTLRSLTIYTTNKFSPAATRQLKERLPNLWSFTAEQNRVLTRKPKSNPEPTMDNKVAPSFALKTLDGKDIKLEDYRGKVVVLYFWATWCKPCVAATPELKKVYTDLKASFGDDFEMISLSMDNSEHRIREHISKYGLTWPQTRIGLRSKISSDYRVNDAAPRSFLIGPDGKILLTPESPQVDTKSFIEKVLKNKKM